MLSLTVESHLQWPESCSAMSEDSFLSPGQEHSTPDIVSIGTAIYLMANPTYVKLIYSAIITH